ncbi:uncharacterized protein VP01_4602g1 [Puccinia sorghi]|uniref:Uncharacterized protein n=1 Tax=Puccinia sorghi TaxID=27349 RepID=A0A0L6UP96_9BASI|nr:uncharacterized protein VP01_4602g1 [Puccinia sorghi]
MSLLAKPCEPQGMRGFSGHKHANLPLIRSKNLTDNKMIQAINARPEHKGYTILLNSIKSISSRRMNPKLSRYKNENKLLLQGHFPGSFCCYSKHAQKVI